MAKAFLQRSSTAFSQIFVLENKEVSELLWKHTAQEITMLLWWAGGHGGVEASLAAARLGMNTLLFCRLSLDHIALMPCNPSVAAAKGHVVREIDALGGQMGINIDKTQIQIRLLNTSKGPGSPGLRAQADKKLYQETMTYTVECQEGLDVKQAAVEEILTEGNHVKGVRCNTGAIFEARAIILTTGTYLKSRIIMGDLLTPCRP